MQQKSELPEGWIFTSLGGVAELISGTGFPQKFQGITGLNYPFFKVKNLADVTSKEHLSKSQNTVDDKIVSELKAKIIPRDSILFAKIGMAIGLNRRRLVGIPCCIDNNMMAAIPNNSILPRYLLKYLETIDFMQFSQATTVPSLRKSDLDKITLPLPPILEQHRIVSAIEALFARLDATNEKLDHVMEVLKKFRESVLAAACEGNLTEDWRKANPDVKVAKKLVESIIHEKKMQSGRRKASLNNDSDESIIQNIPESWFESNLDKISIKITDGTHHSPPNGPEGDFKYITAKNIKNDGIDLKNVTFVSSEIHDGICSRCNPEYGDLLLIKDGATTGIVTLNNLTEPFSMLSSVALLKFPENISNKYIMYYMRSPDFQSNVLDKMGGAAITRLTLKKISNMIVALPPLPEQQEIVRRVDALFAFADSIEAKVKAAKVKTEKLRQSILAKAFSGQLVEKEAEIARREGRGYETAEVLIERIKTENRR